MNRDAALEIVQLSKTFGRGRTAFGLRPDRVVRAVDEVSFTLAHGETLGIVGESGSGKSTTARLIMRLIEPTSGSIRLGGADLRTFAADDIRWRRGIQMIFQDPFASLNPRLSIGYQLAEPMLVHGLAGGAEAAARVATLLERVGLNPIQARSYPHQFSGGQRQRIAIARALAAEPRVIIADEAVSALDVSVRAQILNLISDIRRASDLSMIFISHDLSVVRYVADRVAVMHTGRIVEIGPVEQVLGAPRHPYTLELLNAMPVPRVGARRRRAAMGTVASKPFLRGCGYASRCALATDRCRSATPPLLSSEPGRASACFRSHDVAPFESGAGQIPSAARERLGRLQQWFQTVGKARGKESCVS
jgi:oligopeptide transport system ATP-binding protein